MVFLKNKVSHENVLPSSTHLESIDTLLMISSHAFLQGAKNCRGAIVIFFEGGLPARSTLKLAKKKTDPTIKIKLSLP